MGEAKHNTIRLAGGRPLAKTQKVAKDQKEKDEQTLNRVREQITKRISGGEKMLRQKREKQQQMEIVILEQLVPQEHFLRKVENAVDFSFINKLCAPLYCADNGRPAIRIQIRTGRKKSTQTQFGFECR